MSMTVIEHIEVGSGGAASIVLDEIPDTFTDLKLVVSSRYTSTSGFPREGIKLTFNSTGSTFYSQRLLYAFPSSTPASASASGIDGLTYLYSATTTNTANTFSSLEVYVPNYASSAQKSVSIDSVVEHNGTNNIMNITAGLWNQTTAIGSLELTALVGNFAEFSSATLFGITAGSSGGVTVS